MGQEQRTRDVGTDGQGQMDMVRDGDFVSSRGAPTALAQVTEVGRRNKSPVYTST